MQSIEFELEKGITVGDTVHRKCGLKNPTVSEVLLASQSAEQLVLVPVGVDEKGNTQTEPQLVPSPSRMAMEMLRLQITHIGDFFAPIEYEVFNKLSAVDLNLLNEKASELEQASMQVILRGRDEPASASAEETD